MDITLTEKAIRQFEQIFAKNEEPDAMLKIGVRNGGCAGMSYTIDLVKDIGGETIKKDMGSFQLVIEAEHQQFIKGLVLDYNDSLLNSGFRFSNPNAHETCGCGSSFSVKKPEEQAG